MVHSLNDVLTILPDAATVRKRLSETLQEAQLLRDLLRMAERRERSMHKRKKETTRR